MYISIRLFGVELRTMDLVGPRVCFSYCRRIFYLCLTIFIAVVTGYERVAKVPRFKFVETNLTYVQGEMAVLKCAVENLGTKSVTWRKLPYITPILAGERRFAADLRYSANHVPYKDEWNLLIRNAQTSDSGIYECQVSSKHRTLRQNISLRIIERRYKKAGTIPKKRGTSNDTVRVGNKVQHGMRDVADILRSTAGTIFCLIVLQYVIKSWQLML
ncbi:uncharacterized protein LOC117334444 isoform X3 [Pecten maximus]|uniref:uncharacterized protein LOC117334444 isoform X3 n=1 Tax=Pecten maximus TaxID=6579 RepID=UPI0014584FA1|nr:uncharacterized protein LOC117334444 isoform X3 [Pecten maximus]